MARTLILLLCGFLIVPVPVWAATPTHDATTEPDPGGQSWSNVQNNVTLAHTRGTGQSNYISFFCITWQDSTPGTISGTPTADGNNMSLVDTQTNGSLGAALYYYVGIGTGAKNYVVSFSEVMNQVILSVSTYYNVNPSAPIGTAAKNSGSDSTPTVNVSSAVGELVVDCGVTGNRTVAVGASQAERANQNFPGNSTHYASDEAGAASVTMSWAITPSASSWGIVGVPLKPSIDSAGIKARKPVRF